MLQDTPFQVVIMAAGMGTRLRSRTVKVLHEVLGKPLIGHVVDTAIEAGAERVVSILGHQREAVEAWLDARPHPEKLRYAYQDEQLGTAHAVWSAREFLDESAPSYTVILSGDVPNIDARTLRNFIKHALASKASLAVMTAELEDPASYGRILRNSEGAVTGIVEFRDATHKQREIREINSGIYVARTDFLATHLPVLCSEPVDNVQKEYYLTDLVEIAARTGEAFGWPVPRLELIQGVNNRADLAEAIRFARERINQGWMEAGVTIIDPAHTLIEADVTLGVDVTLYPGVHLSGATRIGDGSIIETGCVIRDTEIGQDSLIKAHCYFDDAAVGDGASIGPFAHLRPGANIGHECKIGNFVEIKNTRMDDKSKASHLTYLGDAHVGEGANVGAGTITCNYDGKNKHRTTIGPGAFIGSNTALVAPVHVGEGAYVGAGSVITNNVPDGALGVARGRQKNIEGWGRRKR